jgi:hypothetical protein
MLPVRARQLYLQSTIQYGTAQSKAMVDEAPTLNGVTGYGQPEGILAGDVEFALAKCPCLGAIPARRSGLC